MSLGGQGPAHAIAQEAQLHRATDEATFRGHARLWQQANSIAGPVIVLDRPKKTLVVAKHEPRGAGTGGAVERRAALEWRLRSLGQGGMQAGRRRHAVCDSGARGRPRVLRRRTQGGDGWRRAGHGGCGDGLSDLDFQPGGTVSDCPREITTARRRAGAGGPHDGHAATWWSPRRAGVEPESSWRTRARPESMC